MLGSSITCFDITDGIAGDCKTRTDHAADITGAHRINLAITVFFGGMDLPQLGDVLFLVLIGALDSCVLFQLAAINTNPIVVACFGRQDFEDQSAKRFFRIRFPRQRFVSVLRIDTFDRRSIERTGQEVPDRGHQRLNPDSVECRTAQHRLDLSLDASLTKRRQDHVARHLFFVHRQIRGFFAQFIDRLEHLLAIQQSLVLQLLRYLALFHFFALGLRIKLEQLHVDQIDHAAEWIGDMCRTLSNRQLDRHRLATQSWLDVVEDRLKVRPLTIEFIDKHDARHIVSVRLPPNRLTLGLDAFAAEKTTTAPSRTRRQRSTSAVKSTWPGVSNRLMLKSCQLYFTHALKIVMPRIPLPPQAQERRRLVGHYGQLDVYVFDLYSIALSKIARGFETDFEDVLFLLVRGLLRSAIWSLTSTRFYPVRSKWTLSPAISVPILKRSVVGGRIPDDQVEGIKLREKQVSFPRSIRFPCGGIHPEPHRKRTPCRGGASQITMESRPCL